MLSAFFGFAIGLLSGYSMGVVRMMLAAANEDSAEMTSEDWSYYSCEQKQKTDGPVSREVLGQLPAAPDRTRNVGGRS